MWIDGATSKGAAERVDQACASARDELSSTAVELALTIARELVRAEVKAGRHALEEIVRETLAASEAGRAACTVHLHPEDALAMDGVALRASTALEADVEVPRGHVHVETARGLVVRDLDAALDEVAERLREAVA